MSATDTFRQRALANRYLVIRALTFHLRQSGQGAASVGYDLTQTAIRAGYVADRRPIDGSTLDGWIAKRNPPAWGVRAAILMLQQIPDFTPSLEQMESIALVIAELFPDKDAAALANDLPAQWAGGDWLPTLETACQVRKRKIAE